MNPLPGVLAEIADVAGEPAALAIAEARGGTQVYIPPIPAADHWLSQLIGHDAARAVADRLTCGIYGLRVDLPVGPAGSVVKMRAEVDRMLLAGCSELEIAMATRYTTRGIRMRAARLRRLQNDRQLSFF